MAVQCDNSNKQDNAYSVEEKWKRNSCHLTQDSVSKTSIDVLNNLQKKPTVEDVYRLSYTQSTLLATIFEDALTALRILEASNNELSVCKTLNEINVLRSLKFDIEQPVVKDELDGIDRTAISLDTYKLKKLDNDRKQIADTLIATYIELSKTSTWKVLNEKVKLQDKVYDYRNIIAEEEANNRVTRRELARRLRQQRNHIKSANYDTDMTIERLRATVEDSALNLEVRTRYTENWERARFEQHAQTITDKEVTSSEAIDKYKQHIEQEERVHVEAEMLINISINETLRKVESWMSKYDKDIEAIDVKIQIKKLEYELSLEKREELEKTLEKHQEEIAKWLRFKEEREIVRLYHEKMHRSAIAVQSWWRGLLVRFQLGPYKISKRPTKPKAKKK